MMRYAELHCKTNFSFLEGASHPSELVERAADIGYAALAVTDRNSVAGVVRASCGVISAPMMSGNPISLAAACARTTPATLLRSVTASAA
jgi:DNA polymerase III alpha subunit